MRMLFIQPEFENVGIEYISAALKTAGHQVDLLFIPRHLQNNSFKIGVEDIDKENKMIAEAIKCANPDVIGFSPFTSYFRWSVEKSTYIKKTKPGIFILYGGVHATFIPEGTIAEPAIDALLVGESDNSIVYFANNFHDRDKLLCTPNLWIKHNGHVIKNPLGPLIQNLDDLPYPDKDLFYDYMPKNERKGAFNLMASRGCPYKCTYCCNDVYSNLYTGENILRFQSPEYVIEQLKYFKNRYNYNRIAFEVVPLVVEGC